MMEVVAGGGRRRGRMARVAAGCVAIAVIGVSCGGDDDTATPAPSVSNDAADEQTGRPTLGSGSDDAAAGDTPDAAAEPDAADGDEVADDEQPAAAEPLDCPPDDAVSAAWGLPFELDEAGATTGAIGLVFCPYDEVIAPGTTDQWGMEPVGEFFSITMTNQDPVIADPTAESVDGLGERANWYPGAGELSVWADGRGVIVSVPFTPEGTDDFRLATSLAGLALGVDATGASSTPADPDDIAAAAAQDAAGCPDPAEVGAAAGREVVLADGAIAQEGEGLCPYLAAGDDPYAFTVNIGLSRDDFYPIEPDEPTEEIDDMGERAIWQPGYHLLFVWTGAGRISVQVSGSGLSGDDEREVAIAIAQGLM
jgi:hypothetical protein